MERLKPLIRILTQQREFYPIIVIYSICISVLILAIPISVQSLVNTFTFGPYIQPLIVLSVLLFGLLVVLGVLKSLQYLLVEYLQRRLYAKITANIARAYLINEDMPQERLQQKANRYFDVITLQKTLSYLVTDGIAVILQTILGLFLIGLYHPFFIVFGLLILVSITLPLYIYLRGALKTAVEESTEKYTVANFVEGLATESLNGLSTEEKLKRVDRSVQNYLTRRAIHFRSLFSQNVIYISLYAFLNALLLGLGGYLVISNQLTVGQLVAAEIVVNAILSNFLYAQKYLESFYDMYAAACKVHLFYDAIDECLEECEDTDKPPLFRASFRDYHKNLKSVQSVYSPRNYKKIFRNFALGFIAVIVTIFLTPWMQNSRGNGRVIAFDPNDRPQAITATVSGMVDEWLVQDGQVVKKGDPILRIIDNDPNYLVRLESQRDAAVAKFEAAREASDTARLNFHRQETLVKEGLSAQKEFEKAKITYKKLQAEEAAAAASLAKAEVDLSRQQLQIVTAPKDGQILRILVGSGTINVKAGEKLVEFVPMTNENVVELYIDANDLPLVHPGRHVRLQFEGWPAVQFTGWPSIAIGSFGGIVSVVDPSVAADGTFRVIVKPDPDDDYPWPDSTFLRQGARTIGLIILDQVSIGYELWRQINGFPKSMSEPPKFKQKLKSIKRGK